MLYLNVTLFNMLDCWRDLESYVSTSSESGWGAEEGGGTYKCSDDMPHD